MQILTTLFLATTSAALFCAPAPAMAPWPTEDWTESTPEAQGLDRDALIAAFSYGVREGAQALVVTRHGYIVGEWYAAGWSQETKQLGWSISKSFTSALVGMLIAAGEIGGINDRAALYLPEWRDADHGGVTVANLLSMDSGLKTDGLVDLQLLTRSNKSSFAISLPMEAEPGTHWEYSNAAVQVLGELVHRASGLQPHEYAREHLWNVIGMWDAHWRLDDVGNPWTFGGIHASAREFAKFGYVYLRDGEWDGEQVVPAAWVRASTQSSQPLFRFYGYLWWLNRWSIAMPDVPADAYAAMGAYERRIYVVPSLDIVAVRLGKGNQHWDDNLFLGRVCGAVIEE